MGFLTNGEVHHSGIKNEETLQEKLENDMAKKIYPNLSESFVVERRGGTANKEDVQIVDGKSTYNISAKHKKGVDVGSYDYVNSSSATHGIPALEEVRIFLSKKRKMHMGCENMVKQVREELKILTNKVMKKLTSSDIRNILLTHVNQKNKDMKMIITDSLTGENHVFDFADTAVYNHIQNHTPSLKWKSKNPNQTSAKIAFINGEGKEHDCGLRLRVVTNNGINALLGLSKSNKNSTLTIKIQQDGIRKMLETTKNHKIFY
tara:strand:- start:128 stop:913 length:786 start_codon:yes stop_codon:yes gene_type:complete